MRAMSAFRMTSMASAGLVLLATIVSVVAASSALIFGSPLSPLIPAGVILAATLAVVSLHEPVWALYVALFVALLPEQVLRLFPIPVIAAYLPVLGFLLACAFWLFGAAIRSRRILWTNTNLVILVFLAWSLITLFWAANPVSGRRQLMAYTLDFVLLLLIVNEVDSQQTLNGLMVTLALSGWVIALVGVGTVLLEGYTPGTRLQILGMNENGLGMALLVILPCILWQAMNPETHRNALRALMVVAFLLLAIGLVAMSGSRGSIISLLVTLLAFMLWKSTRPWGVVGLLILAAGAALAPLLLSTTLTRFAIERGDTLLGGREALWQAATRLILEHPWGGVGVGNAPYAVVPYVRLLRSVFGYETVAIHNPVLTIWAETGLVGIVFYLGILGSALWSFVQNYRRHRRWGSRLLTPYFALVSSTFLGYMASWIKGGGIESDLTYFLLLGFLLIPSAVQSGESVQGSGS